MFRLISIELITIENDRDDSNIEVMAHFIYVFELTHVYDLIVADV